MSSKLAKRKSKSQEKKKGDVWQILDIIWTKMLVGFSCVWIFLILVVLPLYFQEGYVHIGSDKSYLFRTAGANLGKFLLPVLALWGSCRVICVARLRWQNGEKLLQKEDLHRLEMVDICAALYLVAAVLSYLCTEYRETALWGTKGWYMGLVPQSILVVSYFVLSRFEFVQLGSLPLLVCFPISAVTFVLGYLNRFDIWPLNMPSSGLPDYISTIGNINWYCSYVVLVLFVGVALFMQEQGAPKWRAWLWIAYLWLGFGALVTQGSDSGIFATLCMMLILFHLAVRQDEIGWMLRFWQVMLLFSGAGVFTWILRVLFPGRMNYTSELWHIFYSPFAVVLLGICVGGLLYTKFLWQKKRGNEKMFDLFRVLDIVLGWAVPIGLLIGVVLIVLNTLHPGSIGPLSNISVFTFDYLWGSRRGATWMLGAGCFANQDLLHKLVGVGPDCMSDYLYSDSGVAAGLAEVSQRVFVGLRLTNAHCEILTILVNMGLLGAVSYVGMLVGFFKQCFSGGEKHHGYAPNSAKAQGGRPVQGGGKALNRRDPQGMDKYAAACAAGVLALALNNIWSFQQSMGVSTMFVVMALGVYFRKKNG